MHSVTFGDICGYRNLLELAYEIVVFHFENSISPSGKIFSQRQRVLFLFCQGGLLTQ